MYTQTQFQAFKTEALAKQPIRKSCLLSDLQIETMDSVTYSGLTLGLSRRALKDLVKIIGFSNSGTDQMKTAVGEEAAMNILNSLKQIIGSSKKQITLIVTPDRCISRITTQNGGGLISIETYFDTFERLANRHNLEIQSTSFNPETGFASISTLASTSEFQVANLSDEVFRTGLSFSRNLEGIQADPYMHRLVCTNGMVTRQFEESYQLNSLNPKMWQEFYQHLERIEKVGFAPSKFTQSVLQSKSSPASLAELELATNLLTAANLPESDLEIFLKGIKKTYYQFNKSNIDCTKLTQEQRRNLRTGVNHWDLINGITDFASHNYGYEKKPNSDRHLQVQAGDLLSKRPDTTNLISNQPF